MPATIKCLKCGKTTHARVLDQDWTINSIDIDDDNIDWKDEDTPEITCEHEEYEIIEIEDDCDDFRE